MLTEIQKRLFELQDVQYREFMIKLIPTVDEKTVIGIRTPLIRKLAKSLTPEQKRRFTEKLPHRYFEENNLHVAIIEQTKDYGEMIEQIEKFLPHIDNWATCDMMRPKVFKKHPSELLLKINEWVKSDKPYTVRFALEMLMCFYLDDEFKEEYLKIAAQVKSDEYYVKMMVAWFFATALAKQYESTLPYVEQRKLEKWTHNKAIQKSIESFRITKEQKEYLKTLKV
ncbi:MAG: DNA alkylation repair protein [Clostridia bacterium]|nr:DNA alkylation repair protein [Clostridia bacterium]